jgi:U3 small nucleolar RNA-associated protein 10
VSSLYATILSATGTPLRVLKHIVSLLIRLIVTGSDEESNEASKTNAARALLALVHQRHIGVLRDAVSEVIDEGEGVNDGEDQRMKKKNRKKKADELMVSFSVVGFLSIYFVIKIRLSMVSESPMGSKH